MGTRSVIAKPAGDGFLGRYCHWDGYPEHHVPVLRAIVARDGVDLALNVLTIQHYGWSSLDDEQGEASPDPVYCGGRFQVVSGYGVAYTTVADQSSPEDWINSEGDDWGTEYAYILFPGHLTVLGRRTVVGERAVGMFGMSAAQEGNWVVINTVPW